MLKKSLVLGLLSIAGILPVLFAVVAEKLTFSHPNGFVRKFPAHILGEYRQMLLEVNSYYIAGTTDNYIYLANYTAPKHILKVSYDLGDTTHLRLQFVGNLPLSVQSPWIFIRQDKIYFADRLSGYVYEGSLRDLKMRPYPLNDTERFTIFLPFFKSSFITRSFDTSIQQFVLKKYNYHSQGIKGLYVPDKNPDGIFGTDGMLHYSDQDTSFFFVPYYHNQLLKLDTSLRLIEKYKTIDTVSTPSFRIADLKSDRQLVIEGEHALVNKRSYTNRQRLYVQSLLMAENEDPESFKNCSLVDVYSTSDGSYLHSFYIPDLDGKKISSFVVSGKRLIVLYDFTLVIFTFTI